MNEIDKIIVYTDSEGKPWCLNSAGRYERIPFPLPNMKAYVNGAKFAIRPDLIRRGGVLNPYIPVRLI